MSTYEFKLPDIGEGVTEGEIVKWLIHAGDVVTEDQPMVEVMTDKATVTITSPKSGRITETRGGVGEVVPVHGVLVVFDLSGDAAKAAPATSQPAAATATAASSSPALAKKDDGPAATAVGDIREDLPGMNLGASAPKPKSVTNGGSVASNAYFNEKPLATPATRKLARDLSVDLRAVPPSGNFGRVTKEDIRRHMGSGSDAKSGSAPTRVAAGPAYAVTAMPGDERVALRGVRKRIFDGMTRSKHTAAHFTFVEECDCDALIALRDRLRPAAEKSGTKLTFLPFIVKAVVAAAKKHPSLLSAFDEASNEIVTRSACNIGIATSTEAGLFVPVVRDADRRSILGIANDIKRLGEDAKSGKIRPEDLGGSTFTITSLGAQGGLFATPILNFPEVGILGVHQIKQKPVVKNGQIVIGNVMLLSLSFDHRIIDGHVGAAFAYEIIGFLQDPDRLFLEMA